MAAPDIIIAQIWRLQYPMHFNTSATRANYYRLVAVDAPILRDHKSRRDQELHCHVYLPPGSDIMTEDQKLGTIAKAFSKVSLFNTSA